MWANPILWREIRTLAYGRRPLLVKFAFGVVLALICYFAFEQLHSPQRPAGVRRRLRPGAGAVLSLLARQRPGGDVDHVRARRQGPRPAARHRHQPEGVRVREARRGALQHEGVPDPAAAARVYYAIEGALAYTRDDEIALVRNFGPLLCVLGAILVLVAFVMTLGLHVALRIENSRLSIVHTLGTVFFLSVGTLISIYLIVINGGSLGNQLLSFIAFIGLGIGGLWWVLSADRPSAALTLASVLCPLAMFYSVVNILIAKPGSQESSDPLVPFLVIATRSGSRSRRCWCRS